MSSRLGKSAGLGRNRRFAAPAIESLESRTLLASLTGTAIGATYTGDPNLSVTSVHNQQVSITVNDDSPTSGGVVLAVISSVDGVPLNPPPSGSISLYNNQGSIALTIPGTLSAGPHNFTVNLSDAGGQLGTATTVPFVVVKDQPILTPHSPVYTTSYDISILSKLFPNSSDPALVQMEHDWTMSFDRTTQTLWIALRGNGTTTPAGGNRIIQFDPATDTTKVFNLFDLKNIDLGSDPHGTFFDFDTHATPRLWFTQRPNGSKSTGMVTNGRGEVSYLDLNTGQLVTYDLANNLRALGYTNLIGDFHAVSVSNTGDAWVSDPDDGLLLQLNFQQSPDGTLNNSVESLTGTMVVHKVPSSILMGIQGTNTGADNMESGPHGIDTVVDSKTGQQYIYVSDLGGGSLILLRPSTTVGGPDRWTTFDLKAALQPGGVDTVSNGPITGGVPQFALVDNNETPDYPNDDTIYMTDPGQDGQMPYGNSGKNDVIRSFKIGDLLNNPNATTVQVQTWALPTVPGSAGIPRPNQGYVDRAGRFYYADRLNGVGRIDPTQLVPTSSLATDGAIINAPIISAPSQPVSYSLAPLPIIDPMAKYPVTLPATIYQSDFYTKDTSSRNGINQYNVTGGGSATGPPAHTSAAYVGPFRGALNAASVFYGSLTQSEAITTTIFAETERRQMSVVPGTAGARMAFQVIRSGDLIMTARSSGQINDIQLDVTQAIHGPAISGDTSSIADAQGNIHVYGVGTDGNLLEYIYDATTFTWSARTDIGTSPNGFLTSQPTAFLDPKLGPSVIATDSAGHLILFTDDGTTAPRDLTVEGGTTGGLVYSTPDIVDQNGVYYAYDTNQAGALIEFAFAVGGEGTATFRAVNLGDSRDTMMFQDVSAVVVGPNRMVIGTDGNSRLVAVTIGPNGDFAQNITEITKAGALGYSPYQQPFAARVYSDVSVVNDPATNNLYVFGTNGRDLVEFQRNASGAWQASDLTNVYPANRVFGAPSAYITANGELHVLQIDEDGEVVEYYKLAGQTTFSTQNITLSSGNSASPPIYPTTMPVPPIHLNPIVTPAAYVPGTVVPHKAYVAPKITRKKVILNHHSKTVTREKISHVSPAKPVNHPAGPKRKPKPKPKPAPKHRKMHM